VLDLLHFSSFGAEIGGFREFPNEIVFSWYFLCLVVGGSRIVNGFVILRMPWPFFGNKFDPNCWFGYSARRSLVEFQAISIYESLFYLRRYDSGREHQ